MSDRPTPPAVPARAAEGGRGRAASPSHEAAGSARSNPVPKPGPHLAGAIRRPAAGAGPARRREVVRLHAFVSGTVQGVGFRWWTRSRALELGLVGTATNLADGRVEVVAEGPRHAGERLLALLSEQPPRDPPPRAPRSWYRRPGTVTDVVHAWETAEGGITGFKEG